MQQFSSYGVYTIFQVLRNNRNREKQFAFDFAFEKETTTVNNNSAKFSTFDS